MTRMYCANCRTVHYVRRPQAAPAGFSWSWALRDAAEIVVGTVVLTVCFLGIPFVLIVAGTAAR